MRRLISLLLPLFLAACGADTLRVQSVAEWSPETEAFRAQAETFREVSQQVAEQARRECVRRANVANCDFTILVDLNPNAEANAFQTLDDKDQPVIIFTRSMIESAANADELAFVMGHEAAHHILRHIPRQSRNARDSAAILANSPAWAVRTARPLKKRKNWEHRSGRRSILKTLSWKPISWGQS